MHVSHIVSRKHDALCIISIVKAFNFVPNCCFIDFSEHIEDNDRHQTFVDGFGWNGLISWIL